MSEVPQEIPVRVLLRYRVMALTTAVLLIILVFVGIPLQVAAGRPQVVNDVGTLHGFLYIVYLGTAFSLTKKLHVPRWQMLLVLLAGTVPFCGFVAERKMTRRFLAQEPADSEDGRAAPRRVPPALGARAAAFGQRWFSPRAIVLHVEVLVVAPGCALAGWWQATRALAGNELSWVYSIEWPIFALIAIAGWWHLVHEDPDSFRARRWIRRAGGEHAEGGEAGPLGQAGSLGQAGPLGGASAVAPTPASLLEGQEAPLEVAPEMARLAKLLAYGVAVDFALGIVALAVIPFSRPSGWLPSTGAAVYGVHASVGLAVGIGAAALWWRSLHMARISRLVGWTGAVSVALAGAGGLLTEGQSVMRFFGICVMFVFAVLAACAYLIPTALDARRRAAGTPVVGAREPAASAGEPAAS